MTIHNSDKPMACEVGEFSKADLQKLKQTEFAGLTDEAVNQFALDLLPCVGNPDPEIRDGIVYESYSFLLRNNKLNNATKSQLLSSLLEILKGTEDKNGYLKPFAALDLSEFVRADRIEPYLSAQQRTDVVNTTVAYLSGITDYRGYDDKNGWRHGVAHTADIALQLVLNDKVSDTQLAQLLGAIASQISPESGHAYIHGESERLARPVLYLARRGVFTQEDWDVWFAALDDPRPFESWRDVFKSEVGLAKLHNTKAFLNAVYINASVSQNDNVRMLIDSSLAVMKKLP